MIGSARELALDDKVTADVLLAGWIPGTGERAVSTTVVGGRETTQRIGQECLSQW